MSTEYKYPMWFKGKKNKAIVKFHGINSGVIVEKGSAVYEVGMESNCFFQHDDLRFWEDVTDQYKDTVDTSLNNGGKTDYYQLPEWIKDFDDFAEWRGLNGFQFNMGKAMWTFNTERHSGTNAVRDLNKIIHYAQRELKRLENV